MKASPEALRQALRSADSQSLDFAIALAAYFIKAWHPQPITLRVLLEPIEGDVVFNQRLDLVRAAAGL